MAAVSFSTGARVVFAVFRLIFLLALVPGIGPWSTAWAQSRTAADFEAGRYLVQNFGPADYGQHNGNWAIAQDTLGILYVANTNGVMTFDGVRWTLIPLANRSTARSVAVGQDGRVYVGGHGEVGYVSADSVGALEYHSLVERLPATYRTFGDVWQTFAVGETIWFMAPEQVMRWTGSEEVEVWPADTNGQNGPATSAPFHVSFVVRDTFYVRQRNVGLLRVEADALSLVPGGERFQNDALFVLLPYGDDQMLAISRTGGAFLYDGRRFEPFETDAADFLRENQVYHGAVLHDGAIAIGTERGGLVVLEPDGATRAVLDETSGVRDGTVWFVYTDRAGGLWLALNDGLARVEVPSPITVFDRAAGLEGSAWDVERHEGRIYVANDVGVFVLAPGEGGGAPARFVAFPGIRAACWALESTEAGLLAGCQDQAFLIQDEAVRPVFSEGTTFTLYRSRIHPGRIYAGLSDGLVVLDQTSSDVRLRGRVPEIDEKVYSIQEDDEGGLWLGTNHQGVLRVQLSEDALESVRIDRFGTESGLPEGWANVYRIGERIVVGTEEATYRYEEQAGFVRDSVFGDVQGAFVAHETRGGSVWVYAAPDIIPFRRSAEGALQREETVLRRLRPSQVYAIFSEPDGVVWIGRNDGLVRYDARHQAPPRPPYRALMHRVSGLQDGAVVRAGSSVLGAATVLPFARNALRFEFAAPAFDDVAATRYQYRLQGLDTAWSAWTDESYRDYTQLSEGDYVFRVRALDAYGQISEEGGLAFVILPPWYRAWWAWVLYGMMAATGVYGLVRWRSDRLEEQKRTLQHLVRERTLEIERQREQLLEQARRLQEHDELKSRFFANVSHEFRTPLTLTIGPLEDLRSGFYGGLEQAVGEQVDLALRNARRLLRLINQLLDIARIESGRMTLQARPDDLASFVSDVAAAFVPLAERDGVSYLIRVPEAPIIASYDADQLEKVVGNLLSNAFKFTPRGGEIEVILDRNDSGGQRLARLRIRDTGRGIAAEDLQRVFDRFYRVDEGSGNYAGTGIGLALARELVELHEGSIEVESRPDEGSTFTVCLPLHDGGLEPTAGDESRTGWRSALRLSR